MIACLAILSASVAAIVVINRTEPTAKQIKATRKSAALVETITVERGSFSPTLRVLGTVQPAQEIVLSPRVSGQVVEVSPQFLPGGRVRKGDLLLRIDPADFENALSIEESELEQAEASLKIEEGRQSLAQKELRLLEGTIDDTNRDLVLRAPQIASIRAEVNAAKAAVERAKLDLARSSVLAPFDAQVISRSVNVGSQVSPGDELAQLVGIDEYWISAAVPFRSLRWIQFPTSDQPGSEVTLKNPDAWPVGTQKQARVARMIGTVDERTRLAQVLVAVADPLGETSDTPPLILQSLIEVQIEGRAIEDVVRLERRYVREGDTVWVMEEGQLQIHDTEVLFRDAEYAYIGDGLRSGDEVVTTTLATVAEGVGLRKMNQVTDADPSGGAQYARDSDDAGEADDTSEADETSSNATSEDAAP
ncbi:efflux transporter RND family, MFP subunit [Rhodopirellula maiorica SM1]|uniref:Efflux transporter RND family, MFP subunit n=2 Tax=Novipirellula TaxID=2795426 RepID=M5RGG7_9BACT|nr:efflux transporter RND family, MFP subunit [Rhodopirellula maiorica SM1]